MLHIATSREIGQRCKDWFYEKYESLWSGPKESRIFVSVLYDKLLTEDFIKSKDVCFNFHPGILPEYRGSGAYSWAIINEEKETGVTLHIIDKDIDHGPIIDIRKFPITPEDTAETLYNKAEETILEMFKEWIPKIIAGDYYAEPQDESKAKIYYRRDLEKAKDITRYKRAFTFKGKENAYFIIDGKKIYI